MVTAKELVGSMDERYNPQLQIFQCNICPTKFAREEVNAWELHKLHHTLISLRNIADKMLNKMGDRLY